MKNLYTTLFAVFFAATGFSQSEKKADRFFKDQAFMDASEEYRLIQDKDQEILQNLADSYFYTNRMELAEEHYRQLFLEFGADVAPEYKFRFAHTLRAVGEQEEADMYMSDYLGKEVNLQEWAKELDTTVTHTFSTDQVMRNSAISTFGISFLGDKVVFASTRNEDRPIFAWNKQPYLDLYIADMDQAGELTNISLFPGEINTDTHESSATFNEDETVMYFDRTNDERVKIKSENARVATVSIYRAELVNGEWTNIQALPFTSDQYSTEHPSLSPDGTKLYFASDMPGSLGSFDIYVVDVNEDGTFGEPQNLGPNVNTAQREQFPFISDEGILYFTSNGRMGFGNLDIYKTEVENGSFGEAKNLGATINGSTDDFAFVKRAGEERGYFASNRRGSENLYFYTREEYTPPVLPIEVRETNPETGAQQLKNVGNIHFEYDQAVILPEAEEILDKVVAIMNEYPEVRIKIASHADARGSHSYNQKLSEDRAASTMEYIVNQGIDESKLSAEGYGETMPLNDCVEETGCTEEQYARNRRSEFTIMN